MSKRNRENRARKLKARAKRAPSNGNVPPELRAFAGTGPEAVQARRRFGLMVPFFWLADRTPFTPGMLLPEGSLIIGKEKKGVILGDQVPRVIAEAHRELNVSIDEIIDTLVAMEANGVLQITESEPGIMQRKAIEAFRELAGRVEVVEPEG